jgi:alpha-D-xyloside xylohydrolase
MRSMVMEHPHDPACAPLDRQYQLGEALLVAPIFTEEGEVDFYLPEGAAWTHLLTGEVKAGARWHRERHDFLGLPLYVAPNTVLPWGAEEETPDYDYARGVTLRTFALEDGRIAGFEVASPKGGLAARGTVARAGSSYTVTVAEGALHDWCLEVDGVLSPVQAEAASLTWSARA